MGEIDQLNDSVNHRVAQGDQRVDAALDDSPAEQLKQILKIHGSTVVDCDKEGSFDTARTVQRIASKTTKAANTAFSLPVDGNRAPT
jgi:hypothetical protein